MQPLIQTVDVIMERIPLHSRWASERWQPAAVEIAARAARADTERETVFPERTSASRKARTAGAAAGFEIELHPTEAEGYFLNITAPDPRIFVMWRMFDDGAHAACASGARDRQLQPGRPLHGRRRAGRRRADDAADRRLDAAVHCRALQARAAAQGEAQRSRRRRRRGCATAARRREHDRRRRQAPTTVSRCAAGRSASLQRRAAATAASADDAAARRDAPATSCLRRRDRLAAPAAALVGAGGACAASSCAGAGGAAADGSASAVALPPLESLTIDSDFSPFMQPGVDEAVQAQRAAEAAAPSAVQRDGRARRLHRRLFEAESRSSPRSRAR